MKNAHRVALGAGWLSALLLAGACSSTAEPIPADAIRWTHDGFDVNVSGAVGVHPWDPHSKERYVVVARGATATIGVVRNANLQNVRGELSQAGVTRVHMGLLHVGDKQMWAPGFADSYEAGDSFVYGKRFSTGPVDQPFPVQIWNDHPGVTFSTTSWTLWGSNAIQLWIIPHDLSPGNCPPATLDNGNVLAGELKDAPPGVWPALYRDAQDLTRLRAAIAKLPVRLYGHLDEYDVRGGNGYWGDLAHNAAVNALLGWYHSRQEYLDEAKAQLLPLFSVPVFGNEIAGWSRARSNPSADVQNTYGDSQAGRIATFFNAFIATCVLGPNMANVLDATELEAINAHLYNFAINNVYGSFTEANYYRADGGINLHFHPISVVGGWNWNHAAAQQASAGVSYLTQNECTFYFRDGTEVFPTGDGYEPCTDTVCYGTRACESQYHYPGYLDVGNSQAARFFVRFSDYFGKDVRAFGKNSGKYGISAMYQYVVDTYSGQTEATPGSPMMVLMDGWVPKE